ncbi:hypothetical protein [Romboutsia weinsteinii]|nr:hypothetical protein [Romboutsia weinsteinii]
MDLDLLFKIVLFIVAIGISFKVIKAVTGMIFKLSLLVLILLMFYKMFI